jgi:hypothetical protein
MSMEYDPEILRKRADKLYRRAALAARWSVILGSLSGLVAWVIAATATPDENPWPFAWLVPAGAGVGFFFGRHWACNLRLKAQRTLAQAETVQDPNVLRKYADEFYRRANWAVPWSTTIGFLFGLVTWGLAAAKFPTLRSETPHGWLVAVGLALGFLFGRARASNWRLKARRALRQAEIEENTRGAVSAAAPTAGQPPQ